MVGEKYMYRYKNSDIYVLSTSKHIMHRYNFKHKLNVIKNTLRNILIKRKKDLKKKLKKEHPTKKANLKKMIDANQKRGKKGERKSLKMK